MSDPAVSTQREPELAGQTLVVIAAARASGSKQPGAPGLKEPASSSPPAAPAGSSKRRPN